MGNFIVAVIIFVSIGAASYKIYKDKKNNIKCSGCPSAQTCNTKKECN